MNSIETNRSITLKEKPTGVATFYNLKISLYGKLPNKFQRFMIKKILGIQIDDLREGDKNV